MALVLDDRQSHLAEIRAELEKMGYDVTITKSLAAAKQAVKDFAKIKQPISLIVSDSDLGNKLWQKHRVIHGFFFVRWCLKRGIDPAKIVYHSTSFEPTNRLAYWLHTPVRRAAAKRGVKVQGKSVLMPSYRNGGKGPPRKKR